MSQNQSVSPHHRESLNQLSKEELVEMILVQQKLVEQLQLEIEKLTVSRDLDSKNSSKPPSTDLLKKPEKAKTAQTTDKSQAPKRKPGGQPGHQGKTRQGFARVDRQEVLSPQRCHQCGQSQWLREPVKVDSQQVAELVSRPIEVVEYHRHH